MHMLHDTDRVRFVRCVVDVVIAGARYVGARLTNIAFDHSNTNVNVVYL